MSRTMKGIQEKKLISCQNPKDYSYKIYLPTKLGIKIAEKVSIYGKSKNDN